MTDEAAKPVGGSWGGSAHDGPTRHERREHLRVLETMVYQGWDIPPEVYTVLPQALQDIASSPEQSTRDRIRAGEALSHLIAQRIEGALQLDRINRLDAGTATDRVEVLRSITDEQLAAVAASILPAPAPCPPSPADKPEPKRKPKRRR